MPKSGSLIVPIGSNMTDAAYPFRGVYKVKDTLSHGHGGAPINGRSVSSGFAHSTSLTLKVTGNNLRIEEMHVPPSQSLNCELSIDNSAPRKINLNHNNENLCLSVPSDGHTYNLTAVIKRMKDNSSNNVSNNQSQNTINGNNSNNSSSWSATGCRGASKHFCHLILQSNTENDSGTLHESSTQVNTLQKQPLFGANTNMLFIPVRIINSSNNPELNANNSARFRFIVDGHVIEPLNGCYYLPTNARECLLDVFPQTSSPGTDNLNKVKSTNPLFEPEKLNNTNSTVPWPSNADSAERPHYITIETLFDQVDKGNSNSDTLKSGKAVLECPALSLPAMSFSTPSSNVTGEIIELSSQSPSLIPVHHGLYKLHLPARTTTTTTTSKLESTMAETPAQLATNKSGNEKTASYNLPKKATHNAYSAMSDSVPDIETKWEELDDGTRVFVVNAAGFLITLTTTTMKGAVVELSPEAKSITGMNSVRLVLPSIKQEHISKEFIHSSLESEQRITMTLADIHGNIKLRQTHCLPLQINKSFPSTTKTQETTTSPAQNLDNVPIASTQLPPSLSVPLPVPPVIPLPVTLPGVQNAQLSSSLSSSPFTPQSIALRWEEVPVASNAAGHTENLPQSTSHSLVRLCGNDGTLLSCNYDGNNHNSINRVKGSDGLYIDRSQPSHITIEHGTGSAVNTIVTLDIAPALPSEQQSTPNAKNTAVKEMPSWVVSLAQALQSRTAEEAKRQVEAIDMNNDICAACIVGFVKEQLCRPLPSLSFAVERNGIRTVSCPGYTIVADGLSSNTNSATGNEVLSFIPADAQGNVVLEVKTHPQGRSLSTCQVHLPSKSSTEKLLESNQKPLTQEQVLDSQLVSALVKTLRPSSYSSSNVDLLIEEIKRLASMLLSPHGSELIDGLQRTLQRISTPAQSSIVHDSSDQEIFVTCNSTDSLGFVNIHTRHPEYVISASVVPCTTGNIINAVNENVICQDNETNNMQIIPQHGSFMLSEHLIKTTTAGMTSSSSLPSTRTVIFTARNPVTQQIVSKLQILLANDQCTRDGNAVQSEASAAALMPRGKPTSSLHIKQTSTPYVDVHLKESNNKVHVRLLTPVGMRLIYTIDGQSAMSGSVDVHIELDAERAHHIELSLMNTDDQIVFQQKLNIPSHAIPSYGLTLTEHGLLVDPDNQFDLTYSIDKGSIVNDNNTITQQATAMTNNLIALDNTTGHYVVLHKNERGSNAYSGNEVRLRIPQWLSWDAVNALSNIAQMLTLEKQVWHSIKEKLEAFCNDDANALPLRTLASVLLHLVNLIQNVNASNNHSNKSVKEVKDSISETILQPGVRLLQRAPENELSRVYFRLTGVDEENKIENYLDQ